MTKDCADSRAVATFGLTFAANGTSIPSMPFESCQSPSIVAMRSPGDLMAAIHSSIGSILLPRTMAGDDPIQGSLEPREMSPPSPPARRNR